MISVKQARSLAQQLPYSERMAEKFRLAATADVHCKTSSAGVFKDMFAALAEDVDALALCGDLVDCGLPAEAEILLEELSPVLKKNIPILAVFGNHEFDVRYAYHRTIAL